MCTWLEYSPYHTTWYTISDRYGVKAGDAILAEDKHQPVYSELVKDYKVDYIAGGAGQNSIRVAQ